MSRHKIYKHLLYTNAFGIASKIKQERNADKNKRNKNNTIQKKRP
jgi:hypothetical protein